MPVAGPWQPAVETIEDATAIAYPWGIDFAGPAVPEADHYRTTGATTAERWSNWPDSKVSGAAVTWTGTYGADSYRFLRGRRRRNLSVVTLEDLQNFRSVRALGEHPAIAAMPPDAIDIEYEGGSSEPALVSVTVTPVVSATLLDASLTPQLPTVPWSFAIRAEPGLHATALPATTVYQYGARTDITVDPDAWATVLTGSVDTLGDVAVSDTSFDLALPGEDSFSIHIVPTSTSTDPAQDNWRWQPRIDSLTLDGYFTWPAYRYIYDGGGMWNLRHRQRPSGNSGGWPHRHRQNGGATGGWPHRHRQAGT